MAQENVEKCLSVLRCAKSDNDRFAALLLVTKIVKAEECSPETRRQVFDAIGFEFLKRLLKSRKSPEGCSTNTYRSIASTILACFCTDLELVVHHDLLSLIPTFNEIICLNPSSTATDVEPAEIETDTNLVDDTYQCLLAIVNEDAGRKALLLNKSTLVLSQAVANDYYGSVKALQVILALAHHCGAATWLEGTTTVDSVLMKYAKQFEESQDEEKFKLCDLLTTLCTSAVGLRFGRVLPDWSQCIHKGVRDILQSRLGSEQRDRALMLAASTVECLGLRWVMAGKTADVDSRKFLLLLVHLTCIEVRMTLENCSHEQINEKSSLLSACYSLLEHIINYMTAGPTLDLDDKQVKQLHSAMVGAFNSVILFLGELAADGNHKITKLLEFGSIRVLSSWLAEETSALKEEVYKLLPYLIRISENNFEGIKKQAEASVKPTDEQGSESSDPSSREAASSVDLLRFLLPSLCHFSAEDESRRILVEQKGHILLGQYLSFLWQEYSRKNRRHYKIAMITICGIFMNFAVLEPRMVAQYQMFHDLLKYFVTTLPSLAYDHANLMLAGNFVVLGLMLIRHQANKLDIPQGDCEKFFCSVIHVLSGAHISGDPSAGLVLPDDYKKVWPQLSELWFLGMQAFSSCIPLFPWLTRTILKSGWIPSLLKSLADAKATKVDREVIVAYGTFLSDLSTKKGLARQVVAEKGGKAVAEMYKMEFLLKLLNNKS